MFPARSSIRNNSGSGYIAKDPLSSDGDDNVNEDDNGPHNDLLPKNANTVVKADEIRGIEKVVESLGQGIEEDIYLTAGGDVV